MATPASKGVETAGGPAVRRAVDQPVGEAGEGERSASAAPSRVGPRGPGARDSGTWRAVITTTAAASGRLMKKTSRQDTAAIR